MRDIARGFAQSLSAMFLPFVTALSATAVVTGNGGIALSVAGIVALGALGLATVAVEGAA